MNIGLNQIIFQSHLPKQFTDEESEIRKKAERILFGTPPNNYLCVRVHISARSHAYAAEKALDTLDLIRGIWNLYENRKHFTRWKLGGKPKPVNNIILGPIHFLHFPNGKLASQSQWWYEPNYLEAVIPHKFSNLFELNKYTSDIMVRLDKSKYRKDLETAIIRYARALDECDWNHAFLRLWGVLELLTATNLSSNHEATIKRAAFRYQNYVFSLQMLKQLREFRNRSVHADASNSEMESFLYQLKNVIEDMIYFHLGNSFRFKSLEQAGIFLDLPRDKEALMLRPSMADYGQKFLGYKK